MAVPSTTTLKRLFGLSGNQCAYPGCVTALISGETIVGRVCHIKGDNPGGPRYDASQSEHDRQSYDNLIVLCPTHHVIVDGDTTTWTVEKLAAMKRRHEAYAPTHGRFEISDGLAARIKDAMVAGALVGTAASAASAVMGAANHIGTVVDWLSGFMGYATAPARKRAALRRMADILRYGPVGTLDFGSAGEGHIRLGDFIEELFKAAGWKVRRVDMRLGSDVVKKAKPASGNYLMLLVSLKDVNQLPNAVRTMDEFLNNLGFRLIAHPGEYRAERGYEKELRIFTAFRGQ